MKSLLLRGVIVTGLSGCIAPSGWAEKQNSPQPQESQQPQPAQPKDVETRGQVTLPDPLQAAPSNTRWAQVTVEVTRETSMPNLDEVSTFVDNSAG